ncbi:unnamed protein product [Pseudo-nitzschia multistriata]|uniref:Uncharacterized protein n=1 Tax=Pseudo-nitzschia multistriata TaxID=183589 RepID=A0A448YXE7_9STRA|nr:unnamed protein product [Pseudo-nitzschia multistriata]
MGNNATAPIDAPDRGRAIRMAGKEGTDGEPTDPHPPVKPSRRFWKTDSSCDAFPLPGCATGSSAHRCWRKALCRLQLEPSIEPSIPVFFLD